MFSPGRLHRQLLVDALLRGAALVGLFVAFFVLLSVGVGGSLVMGIAAVAIVVAWVALNAVGAAVARALPQLTAVIERDPAVGETALADLLGKRALPRWVRLMLYHRLAVLRHRQQRFAESAAVAQTLLAAPRSGPLARHRANLLLLLTEARLEMRDVVGAWVALSQLAVTPVSLTEALQRMALRTRYELMAGHDAAALERADEKTRLAELMPGPQCGAYHALLATAAHRVGRAEDHRRWWERVELLCTPEQIAQLDSGLGIAVPK